MTDNQPNATQTEEDLVPAAQKDLRTFDALYQYCVKQVYRYLYSRMGSQPDAEDATAQTFLSALESFDRYRHDRHFAAWISVQRLTDIYTFDQKHFKRLPGITVHLPGEKSQ